MDRDSRIKKVRKGEFRSRLALEDVEVDKNTEMYSITNTYNREESVMVCCKDPIPCPLMQYIFYLKITTIKDKYLKRMVGDLMYLNPGIDAEGIRKMTMFIVTSLVYKKPDSGYSLTYEELHPVVEKLAAIAEIEGVEVYADKVVLFEKDTMLTGNERQQIGAQTRAYRDGYLNSEIIHNKALQIVGRQEPYAVSKVVVHKEVKDKKGLKTIKTFNKHIAGKTLKVLEESLEERKFRSPREADQFEVYKDCREKKMSTAQMVKKMGVSFSTLAYFSSTTFTIFP